MKIVDRFNYGVNAVEFDKIDELIFNNSSVDCSNINSRLNLKDVKKFFSNNLHLINCTITTSKMPTVVQNDIIMENTTIDLDDNYIYTGNLQVIKAIRPNLVGKCILKNTNLNINSNKLIHQPFRITNGTTDIENSQIIYMNENTSYNLYGSANISIMCDFSNQVDCSIVNPKFNKIGTGNFTNNGVDLTKTEIIHNAPTKADGSFIISRFYPTIGHKVYNTNMKVGEIAEWVWDGANWQTSNIRGMTGIIANDSTMDIPISARFNGRCMIFIQFDTPSNDFAILYLQQQSIVEIFKGENLNINSVIDNKFNIEKPSMTTLRITNKYGSDRQYSINVMGF